MSCTHPIDFETLIAYWMGELSEEREAPLEEHLFGCAHCTGRLEEVASLAEGVRAAVQDGRLTLFVTEPFVEAMKQAGLRLREYALDPGASVNCTIRADDDAVVSRIRAPLSGVKRLDIIQGGLANHPDVRIADVPFDQASGEVVMIPSATWLKSMPAFTLHTRLVSVIDGEDEPVGEYTFNHSPS
jgi:hypothetical protein